jgi:hypothetical protein
LVSSCVLPLIKFIKKECPKNSGYLNSLAAEYSSGAASPGARCSPTSGTGDRLPPCRPTIPIEP